MCKSNPIYGIVWPWALLIVIAKAKRIRNWRQTNWNGKSASDSVILIQEINIYLSKYEPIKISISITCCWNPLTINLIPLQSPSVRLPYKKLGYVFYMFLKTL